MSRRSRRGASPLTDVVQKYAAMQDELRRITALYDDYVQGLLDDAGINYLSVTSRTKSVSSFANKTTRTEDGRPVYDDPLSQITDQVGVRVITYVRTDVDAVADLLAASMRVLDDRDLGKVTASQGRFGYASRHLLVALDPAHASPELVAAIGDHAASVQVRTVLQHAWAEFEHDIRYKGQVPDDNAPDLDRRFTLAAGLLELADREFSEIRDQLKLAEVIRVEPATADEPIDADELAAFLGSHYAEAGWSRTDHYEWIAGVLHELGITSVDELSGLITTIDDSVIATKMGYKYPPGAVRRLDDALLAVHGSRYVNLPGNAHRRDALAARLEKLRAD
ncbi:GTP pyrophosphokinase [Nocardioides dubius]|uniref:GTP pyrophosphokinase n=1 Tax=Nocardioides dubius TaxID=317019 RepID=UPI0039E895F1